MARPRQPEASHEDADLLADAPALARWLRCPASDDPDAGTPCERPQSDETPEEAWARITATAEAVGRLEAGLRHVERMRRAATWRQT